MNGGILIQIILRFIIILLYYSTDHSGTAGGHEDDDVGLGKTSISIGSGYWERSGSTTAVGLVEYQVPLYAIEIQRGCKVCCMIVLIYL